MNKIEFAKSTFGGYRTADVDEYFSELQKYITELEQEEEALMKRVEQLENEADSNRAAGEDVAENLSQLNEKI